MTDHFLSPNACRPIAAHPGTPHAAKAACEHCGQQVRFATWGDQPCEVLAAALLATRERMAHFQANYALEHGFDFAPDIAAIDAALGTPAPAVSERAKIDAAIGRKPPAH